MKGLLTVELDAYVSCDNIRAPDGLQEVWSLVAAYAGSLDSALSCLHDSCFFHLLNVGREKLIGAPGHLVALKLWNFSRSEDDPVSAVLESQPPL